MQLSIACEQGDPFDLFADGKRHRFSEGKYHTIQDLPQGAQIEIRQAETRFRWFFFPLYLLLGLVLAVFHGLAQEEITAQAFLHPFLRRCSFRIIDPEKATITIASAASSIDENDSIRKGELSVIGEGIDSIEYYTDINQASFSSAFILLCAVVFSPIAVLLAIFLLLILASDGIMLLIGIAVCTMVLITLSIFSGIKATAERRWLQDLKQTLTADIH